MNEIIAALQEEIAAAKRMRHDALRRWHESEVVRLTGYIEGMKKAVEIMTKEPVPFTAENGDCSFMENGDLR